MRPFSGTRRITRGGNIAIGSKEGTEAKLSQDPKRNIENHRRLPDKVSDQMILDMKAKATAAQINTANKIKFKKELEKYIKANELEHKTNAEYQKTVMVVMENLAAIDADFAKALHGYRFGIAAEKVELNAFQSAHGNAVKFNPF
jgi:hypothetical protein